MPINTLKPTDLVGTLDTLRHAVLGIDAEHYFHSYAAADPNYSKLLSLGVHGSPAFEQQLKLDLESLSALEITPIFVFPGLKVKPQSDYIANMNTPYEDRLKNTWNTESPMLYDATNPFIFRSFIDEFVVMLQRLEIEYLIAPFTQFHQLYYMLKNNVINAIFSSNDCLLFQDIENFIIKFDFPNKFSYIDNEKVYLKYNSFKKFRDFAMCIGNSIQPNQLVTDVNFQTLSLNPYNHFIAYDKLKNSSTSLDVFNDGCAVLDYCPVLKINGRIEPIKYKTNKKEYPLTYSLTHTNSPSVSKIPSAAATPLATSSNTSMSNHNASTTYKLPKELNKVFGDHLPDELYFYQSIGLNMFNILETILTTTAIERLPLDMQIDPIYEKVVSNNTSLKLKELLFAMIISKFNRYFVSKKITMKVFFNGNSKLHSIDHKGISTISSKSLVVRHTTAKSFDLPTFLLNFNNEYLSESIYNSNNLPIISSNHEIISTSLLRTLKIYKFITEDNKISKWGEIVSRYADDESIILLLVFLQRFNDLDIHVLASLKDTLPTSDNYDSLSLNLMIKFALFYGLDIRNGAVSTSISRNLLHFNSSLNKLTEEIKDFLNINIFGILSENKMDIEKYSRCNFDWNELITEIPFKLNNQSTVPGLIVEKAINVLINQKDDFKTNLSESLKPFSTIVDNPLKVSLKIFKFIIKICDIVDNLSESKLINDKLATQFVSIRKTVDEIVELF